MAAQGLRHLAGADIPQFDGVIERRRGEALAILAKGDAEDRRRMTGEPLNRLSAYRRRTGQGETDREGFRKGEESHLSFSCESRRGPPGCRLEAGRSVSGRARGVKTRRRWGTR